MRTFKRVWIASCEVLYSEIWAESRETQIPQLRQLGYMVRHIKRLRNLQTVFFSPYRKKSFSLFIVDITSSVSTKSRVGIEPCVSWMSAFLRNGSSSSSILYIITYIRVTERGSNRASASTTPPPPRILEISKSIKKKDGRIKYTYHSVDAKCNSYDHTVLV